MSASDPASLEASSRFVWPPVIYGVAAIAAALLAWLVPVSLLPAAGETLRHILGIAFVLVGILLALAAKRLFQRAGTPVAPTKPTSALVTDGIYRRTRNPMYLGLSLILLGLAVATGSPWFLVSLVVAVYAVTKLAIEKEERYLAGKFGAAYLDYKSNVRRWM
jgi:protein-S-isoprenylcysteine O-methyltransferase Ste14